MRFVVYMKINENKYKELIIVGNKNRLIENQKISNPNSKIFSAIWS